MTHRETIFDVEAPLAFLTFNRPEARNAMTWGMYDALLDACDRVDRDDAVKVMVLRGAGGRAFVSGTDISQFQQFQAPDDGVRYERKISDVLDRLERVTKPTIAQIQGFAVGGGCAMAVTCDLRIATRESSFGIPIARTLGNCVTGAAYSRLVELVGPAAAKDMLFTGRLVQGEEAYAMSLVNRLVPSGDIDDAVRRLATEIASNAPLTVRATKEMTRRLMERTRLAAGDSQDLIELCYGSADFQEGVASFLAKRPPKWRGK